MVAKELTMRTIHTEDGRYGIVHVAGSKFAQIIEYAGQGPRTLISKVEVPYEFLALSMKELLELDENEVPVTA